MLWEPKECCCGISLRTGTLMIAWLGIISSAMVMLWPLVFVIPSREDLVEICLGRHDLEIDPQVCADFIQGAMTTSGVLGGISMVIFVLLLAGVLKNKPNLMLPYLIGNGIIITLLGMFMLVMFVLCSYFEAIVALFGSCLVTAGIMCLEIDLFLLVRACYKEVKQHNLAMGADAGIPYVEQKDAANNYRI